MSYNFSMKNLKKQNDALVFQNAFYDTETGVPTSPIITESFILIQAADSYYLKEATIDETYTELRYRVYLCDVWVCQLILGKRLRES